MSYPYYPRYKTEFLKDLVIQKQDTMDAVKSHNYLPMDYRSLYIEELQYEIDTLNAIINERSDKNV